MLFAVSVSEFSHRKAICLHCYRKTDVTYPVLRAKLLNLRKVRRSYFNSRVYSTVAFVRCNDASSSADLSYNFTITYRRPPFSVPQYSQYQFFLYETITAHREKGKIFDQIANWLNTKGYKTPRGRIFRNNHVHSIVKKRRNRLDIIQKEPTQSLSNISLRYKKTP